MELARFYLILLKINKYIAFSVTSIYVVVIVVFYLRLILSYS